MNQHDAEVIVAIATLAALADGVRDADEHAGLAAAASRLGLPDADAAVAKAAAGGLDLPSLAAQLSDADTRQDAYDTAVAVCHADGALNAPERAFLARLALLLSIDETSAERPISTIGAIRETATNAPMAALQTPPLSAANMTGMGSGTLGNAYGIAGNHTSSTTGSNTGSTTESTGSSTAPGAPDLDAHILDQAILTAALELLPDRLANIAILPLQLRLVRHIGQKHGQEMDASQIKDLAATFGIGAAAQLMESVVRRTLGGLAGGLLGGMFGSAAGMAAGGAVTFASTYALGHAAEQYYRQGRTLSTADLKALFTRFQGEANTLYPRVQDRVTGLARGNTLDGLMRSIRG
ncbi:MAG: hypothetical protein V4617_01515 [Gemmatimonadota bacterium]